MSMFSDPVKIATSFFVFMERVQLPHANSWYQKTELFIAKLSVDFIVTTNLIF